MNVLVTGGAGFIGSHIVDRLIAHGHAVTVLDNLSTGQRENIHLAVDFIHFDVTHPHLEDKLAGRRFDAVVHHAAQTSVRRSLDDPRLDAQVNLVGTMHLLEYACRSGVGRFVFASSAAVYGNPPAIPVAEDAPLVPLSPYAVSKLAAEDFLRQHPCPAGLTTIILRYANVYGPRQSVRGEAGVVCAMMNRILIDKPPIVHGDGQQTRDFVYVDDVVEANLLALAADALPGMYNVGTGKATSILELYHLLAGSESQPEFAPPRPGDVRHSALDCTQARSALGWRPRVPLVEGLARTWRYFFGFAQRHLAQPAVLAPHLNVSAVR
jgi:UDP-glucose 4-epimerase